MVIKQTKIGMLVKSNIKKIFHYCDTVDHAELSRLFDARYSKEKFDINYPFCTEISLIPTDQSKRYWTTTYLVRGKTVRVSSQWFDTHVSKSRTLFAQYLLTKKIVSKDELSTVGHIVPENISLEITKAKSTRANSRYRGNAIGNAQNLVVRNILSNLGQETFAEKDWQETKAYFSNRCAYCCAEGEMLIEHAIPINRQSLGEHRLGNLIPSCKACNSRKGDKDYREFLDDDVEKISKIEQYMDNRNYVPLEDNEQVKMILEMAYQEVSTVVDRYKTILNELFPTEDTSEQ